MADFDMINDAFWLKYAVDHVTSGVVARDAAAGKLDTYLGVVWPIYTTAFTLGAAFSVINCEWYIVIILALPILLIPIARFLCTWVQLPILVEFHAEIPDSIEKNLYAEIIKEKSRRLQWATGFAITCGLSIGISLFTYKMYKTVKSVNYYINIAADKDAKKIKINGSFPTKTDVGITIVGLDSSGKNHLFITSQPKSDEKGKINTLIDNKSIEKEVRAFASFKDENKNTINISSE